MNKRELPIYEIESELVRELPRQRRLVVTAPTGSGKSTQIPQILLDRKAGGDGRIVVLQPRRLAARLLAARVASERGVNLGAEVGFQIRFDDCSSRATRILFVTEGILLRQMLADPSIPLISTIIFDEFHERHVYGDVTLAQAMEVQAGARPDLNIVVMSATLDSLALDRYLAPCSVLRAEGRAYPVDITYLQKPCDPHKTAVWETAADEVEATLPRWPEGDALVFMPGAYEIQRTIQALRVRPRTRHMAVLPLHGELAPAEQDAAVGHCDRRKVVVATNVAETSITIDGIRLVVDSGLSRVARFDPYRGINTLLIEKISRASADQRAGRAGRTGPGLCCRLWTELEHNGRPLRDLPEIQRIDMAEIVLTLKAMGLGDVRAFRWLDPPEAKSLERAESLLADLGAIDGLTGAITELGGRLVSFPVHPRYARMLLAAGEYRCVPSVALIAALTQDRSLLLPRQGSAVEDRRDRALGEEQDSDFFRLMRAWRHARDVRYSVDACQEMGIHAGAARQVERLFAHFRRIAAEQRLDTTEDTAPPPAAVEKCVLAGFSDQLARRIDGGTLRCELIHRRTGTLSRESVVRKSPLLVASEIREVEGRGKELTVLLSLATAVNREWLEELFPGACRTRRQVFLDPDQRRVVVRGEVLFRDLVIEVERAGQPTAEEAASILAEEVMAGRITLAHWNHPVEQWILRVNALSAWCPELALPSIEDKDRRAITEQICFGAFNYKEARDKAVMPAVKGWLSVPQQALVEKHAPERVELANGRSARVTYVASGPPFISLRIQELYGVEGGVRIAMKRVPLAIHILGPNHRPVQITQDMSGFWRNTYPRVKSEMQRKYPKHEWR